MSSRNRPPPQITDSLVVRPGTLSMASASAASSRFFPAPHELPQEVTIRTQTLSPINVDPLVLLASSNPRVVAATAPSPLPPVHAAAAAWYSSTPLSSSPTSSYSHAHGRASVSPPPSPAFSSSSVRSSSTIWPSRLTSPVHYGHHVAASGSRAASVDLGSEHEFLDDTMAAELSALEHERAAAVRRLSSGLAQKSLHSSSYSLPFGGHTPVASPSHAHPQSFQHSHHTHQFSVNKSLESDVSSSDGSVLHSHQLHLYQHQSLPHDLSFDRDDDDDRRSIYSSFTEHLSQVSRDEFDPFAATSDSEHAPDEAVLWSVASSANRSRAGSVTFGSSAPYNMLHSLNQLRISAAGTGSLVLPTPLQLPSPPNQNAFVDRLNSRSATTTPGFPSAATDMSLSSSAHSTWTTNSPVPDRRISPRRFVPDNGHVSLSASVLAVSINRNTHEDIVVHAAPDDEAEFETQSTTVATPAKEPPTYSTSFDISAYEVSAEADDEAAPQSPAQGDFVEVDHDSEFDRMIRARDELNRSAELLAYLSHRGAIAANAEPVGRESAVASPISVAGSTHTILSDGYSSDFQSEHSDDDSVHSEDDVVVEELHVAAMVPALPNPDSLEAILHLTPDSARLHRVDIQGIHWSSLPMLREEYHRYRREHMPSFRSIQPKSSEPTAQSLARPSRQKRTRSAQVDFSGTSEYLSDDSQTDVNLEAPFFDWLSTSRAVRPRIQHFQLHHMICAPFANTVFYVDQNSARSYCMSSRQVSPEPLLPLRSVGGGVDGLKCSTMHVAFGQLLLLGGMHGELAYRRLNSEQLGWYSSADLTGRPDENALLNSLASHRSPSGAPHLLAASNSECAFTLDATTWRCVRTFDTPWPVNRAVCAPMHSSSNASNSFNNECDDYWLTASTDTNAAHPVQPASEASARTILLVGDSREAWIVDADSGAKVHTLKGHRDYCFAAAFSHDGNLVATGSQDRTARVYDLRRPDRALYVLPAARGAVRSLAFTNCISSSGARYLAAAEDADLVRVYDCARECRISQDLEFFGDVAGIAFAPDDSRLLIGVDDQQHACLLEFQTRREQSIRACEAFI